MAMPEDQLHHGHQLSSMPPISSLSALHQHQSQPMPNSMPLAASAPKKKTAYSMFMVAESKRLRALHPELSHADLMKMVGDAWAQHPENPRAGEPRKKRTWSSRSKKARQRQAEEQQQQQLQAVVGVQHVQPKRSREEFEQGGEDNTDMSNELLDDYEDEDDEDDSDDDDERLGRQLGRLIARRISRMVRRAFNRGEEHAYRKMNVEPPYPLTASPPSRRSDFQSFANEEAKRLQGMFANKSQQEIMKMVTDSWAQSSLNPKNRKRKNKMDPASTPTSHNLMSTPKPYTELLTESALHTEDIRDHMKGPEQQHYAIDFGDSDSSRYDQRKGTELGGLPHGAL